MNRHQLTRTLTLTAVLSALILAAGPALAQPAPRGSDHRGALAAYRAALARVGLSEEQQAEIRAIAEGARKQEQVLRAQHLADRAQLKVLLAAEDPEPVAIGNAVLALENHREQMRSARREAHEATLAVLTHDQRIAFERSLATLRAVERHRSRGPRR